MKLQQIKQLVTADTEMSAFLSRIRQQHAAAGSPDSIYSETVYDFADRVTGLFLIWEEKYEISRRHCWQSNFVDSIGRFLRRSDSVDDAAALSYFASKLRGELLAAMPTIELDYLLSLPTELAADSEIIDAVAAYDGKRGVKAKSGYNFRTAQPYLFVTLDGREAVKRWR